MRKHHIVENDLLPLKSISLARFVTDIQHPLRHYHDPFANNANESKDDPDQTTSSPSATQQQQQQQQYTITLHKQNVQETLRHTTDHKTNLHITELAHLFSTRNASTGAQFNATITTTYELDGWEAVFRCACASPKTRAWLEDAIEDDRSCYFVVGYKTFGEGASVERERVLAKEKGVDMKVPVSTVVEANLTMGMLGSGSLLGGVLDPGAGGSVGEEKKATESFEVGDEAVYEVLYCKVLFKWYSSKKVEKSFLSQRCWKVGLVIRGSEVEDEDDVVEAMLESGDDDDDDSADTGFEGAGKGEEKFDKAV